MTHLKTVDLREKSKAELLLQVQVLRKELLSLRVQKVSSGNAPKFAKISIVRKSIARLLTVLSQTQRAQLKLFYKDKKYIALDLREKKTRAIRRALSPAELAIKTVRVAKKEKHFSIKKYAVKA